MLEEAAERAHGHFKRRRDWKRLRVTGDDTSTCHGDLTLESRNREIISRKCLLFIEPSDELKKKEIAHKCANMSLVCISFAIYFFKMNSGTLNNMALHPSFV